MQEVPSKKGEKLSFYSPLKKYISSNYSEDPASYEADLQALDDLRARAVNTPDVDNSLKYYAQLQFLSAKFPINEKGIKVQFSWSHAFSKKKFSSYGINFEKASVLFNLGAAYSQRAHQQNLKSPDGVKMAFNFYQLAAGAFAILKENSPVWFPTPISTDLSVSTVTSLETLMLAQAQECFLLKAIADQKSAAVISKLAGQAADLYDQSYDAATSTPGVNGFEGRIDWLSLIQIKALYLNALAHNHLAPASLAAMKYGEEISRLDLCMVFLSKAAELSKANPEFLPQIRELQASVHNRLVAANKDNDKIYHELIPAHKTLTPVGRHLMVKTAELSDLSKTSVVGAPLFQRLVPMAVHKAAAAYKAKKEAYIFEKLSGLNDSTNALNNALVTMNLPAALDALEQPVGLPPGLLARAEEVRNNGGASSLVATCEHLAHTSKEIEKLLNEGLKLLEDEEREDNALRSKYGSRWIRTPSATLNGNLKTECGKHRTMLQGAAKSDAIVKNKLDANRPIIEQLSASPQDLEKAVPSSSVKGPFSPPNPHIVTMRRLVDEILALKKSNDTLAEEIKNFVQKDDIVPLLLETYGTKDISDPGEAFETQLRGYDPLLVRIADNVGKQEGLVAELLDANHKFQETKSSNEFIQKREQALKLLDDGYRAFQEIRGNQKEGLKFYSAMESIATVFKGKCDDFCVARQTEMTDLLAALQSSHPPPPSHQPPPSQNPYNLYSSPYGGQHQASAPPVHFPNQQQPGYNPYYPFPQNPYY